MNLNVWKEVVNAALPSLNRVTMQDIFCVFDVNGAAIDASLSDSDTPISAYLRALQSFAPSPHMPTVVPLCFYNYPTSNALSSGAILA
jgi:hypothetical protein